MKKIVGFFLLIAFAITSWAQHEVRFQMSDSLSGEALIGATIQIKELSKVTATDVEGNAVLLDIPSGEYDIEIASVGFKSETRRIKVPQSQPFQLRLLPDDELEEIEVLAVRSNKSIAKVPTRVEVLTDEISEAATMDPARIAHLITHSTGVQVQQTSATSGNSNVRIQGLEGRYTLFTRDGFPLFGGFSGSLSIMQIPPLDLRQVEYIKGPASTLYGGGAIGGLINLVSKKPTKDGEYNMMFNQSHIGATDASFFSEKQYDKLGYTFLVSGNMHAAYNPDKDNFSDIPWQQKLNINPRLYYYASEKTEMYLGFNFVTEDREGGDMDVLGLNIKDSLNYYKESNFTQRLMTQYNVDHKIDQNNKINIKTGWNIFDRAFNIQSTPILQQQFNATQLSSFSEASWLNTGEEYDFVTGINFYTDQLNERDIDLYDRSYSTNTLGWFGQYSWYPSDFFNVETGMRTDYNQHAGFLPLPRISTLFNWSEKVTTRIGGAMGYMLPTLFLEEAEVNAFQNIMKVDMENVDPEQSIGVNGDVNYKTPIGDKAFFRINQLFFYNQIQNPQFVTFSNGAFEIDNLNGYKETMGFESSIKVGYDPFTLFVGYTYTDAQLHFSNDFGDFNSYIALTPRHSLKGDLLMDIPDKWQIAIDYEFQSGQQLSNGSTTKDLFIMGLVMRHWITPHLQVFGNLENFTDVRQTRYESLTKDGASTPQYTEIWAPVDGFYANGGIRLKF